MPDDPCATAATEQCCHGTCKRKQPPMVMRSDLTGTWWVVLRYKDFTMRTASHAVGRTSQP